MLDKMRPAVKSAAATRPDDPIWDVTAVPTPAETVDSETEDSNAGDPIWDTPPEPVGPGDPIWDLKEPAKPGAPTGDQPSQTTNPDDPSTT